MYAEGECKEIVERGKETKEKRLWKATYCLTTAIVNHMNGVAAATPRGPSTGSLIPAQPQDKRPRTMCPVNVTSSDMMPTQVGKMPAPASGLDNGRRLSSERARMVPRGPQRPEAAAQRVRSNEIQPDPRSHAIADAAARAACFMADLPGRDAQRPRAWSMTRLARHARLNWEDSPRQGSRPCSRPGQSGGSKHDPIAVPWS